MLMAHLLKIRYTVVEHLFDKGCAAHETMHIYHSPESQGECSMIYPSWIEFPAKDVDRAAEFYRVVFGFEYGEVYDDGTRRVAILLHPKDGHPGVSVNETADFEPSRNGALIYLNVDGGLTPYLERTVAAGGSIVMTETAMSETSVFAIIGDSEGNAIGISYTRPSE
jgi:uncharacterized protein